MRNINSIRKDIEKTDKKIQKFFLKRMSLVKEMKTAKDELNIPYFDKEREDYLKEKYSKDLKEYKNLYLEFLDNILALSKKYMMEGEKNEA